MGEGGSWSDSETEHVSGFISCLQNTIRGEPPAIGEFAVPAFLIKKQVYDWVKTGEKTIELRRGKSQNGDRIAFLNGQRQCVKGRILRKREGKLDEVLNAATYRKIIPTAKTLDEAMEFIKQLYQSTDGTFTAYEFQLNQEP
jgi:ASC-1-like (ASCH) protein